MAEPTRAIGRRLNAVAWLVIASGRRAGTDIRLGRNVLVGRDATQSDIILDDSTVSSQHLKVRYEGGRFVLYDLGSANGTLVNGSRVQKHLLMDGDEIKLGRTRLIFKEVR